MQARSVKIALITLALIVAVSFAVAQTVKRARWQRGGMFGGHGLAFFSHYLDLTDAQQAQAKDIMAREKPTVQPLLQQLSQSRHQLRQFEETGNFDEAQVRAIAEQRSQTLTELTVQKARIEAELVKILSPEQKAKLTKLMDHREQRMERLMNQQAATENQ